MYRAHPLVLPALAEAGVDVLTLGNNHSGDYGPAALREMLDRLSTLGLGYTGAGLDAADARRPCYRRLGDTVVALVGADLTRTRQQAATDQQAGSLYFDLARGDVDAIAAELTALLHQARQHAQVVVFTPHWGRNWASEPSRRMRRLASRLLEAGYDAIVGHSAHQIQGAEIIGGKPVIYDAGDLLLDYADEGGEAHRAMLWELVLTRAGVLQARGHPITLGQNHTALARGERREQILRRFQSLSAALGTPVELVDGLAVLRGDPGGISGPAEAVDPPRRAPPPAVREAPSTTLRDRVPAWADPIQVTWPNGISLVGYKLVLDEIPAGGGQFVALFWRTDRPQDESWVIHLESRGLDSSGQARWERASHLPGDWLLPTPLWPTEQVVEDWTLFRLHFVPAGPVRYLVGLWDGRHLLAPGSSSHPLEDGHFVVLGATPRREGAPSMFTGWAAFQHRTGATP